MSFMHRTLASTGSAATLIPVRSMPRPWLWTLVVLFAGSALLGLSAQVSVPIGPVHFTGQTLMVLLIGAAVGPRLGAATVVFYIAQGLAGLPVFQSGGAGMVHLNGPSGGYLIGFIAAAAVVGYLAERGWDRNVLLTVAAMVIGNLVIYACGVSRLQVFVGWGGVWEFGIEPFLAGDAVKIALAAGILPGAWWLRERFGIPDHASRR